MEHDRWSRIEALFEEAADLAPSERRTFLDRACAGDDELRREVESLLASDAKEARVLQTSAIPQFQDDDAGADLTGQRIGRYTITGLIGKGGMGAVYRAVREDDFRMQVAVKLLKRGTDTDTALRRFRAERQILAELDHSNIARLLDGGATESGLPYFVMEYVDGTPLLDHAAPLSIRQRIELFRSVCAAVQHAHRHQIVHRDIKPANILVTVEGVPKLLDFGIAKLLDPGGEKPLTVTGTRLMTPDYASPEQVRGEPITTATDIYSLGAVLYALLTGQSAHHIETYSAGEIEKEICTREPKKPSTLVKNLDPDLDNIVLMALRKEPQRRYASAAQLSEDLDRFLHDRPVQARSETIRYRVAKFLKRNRALLTAATAGAVVVLGLVGGLGRFTRPGAGVETGGRALAIMPLENLSGDKDQDYFADGITDSLIGELAQIPELRVISRTSVMSYKGTKKRLPQIARDLGVTTIAEGSVLRSGGRMRITLRLVDAPSERTIWSGNYEGELRDVMGLQAQVTGAIAGEIHVTMTEPARARAARNRRVNLDAYDAFLKGRQQYFKAFTRESTEKAIALFQQALAFDPGYAPGYAGLADSWYLMSNIYLRPTEAMPKAKEAALKALELDDTLSSAHAMLALVRSVYEFSRADAEKEFRRALELEPSNAEIHLWYGMHLAGMGQADKAVAEMELSHRLDPASPAMNAYVGIPLYLAHRYDQAIQRLEPIAGMYPDYHQPHAFLGLAYEQKRDWPKAIAEMERAYELDKEPESLAQLGHIYAVAGRPADARRIIRQLEVLSGQRYVSAYNMALIYAGLGDRDEAFRWLGKVEEDRSEWFAAVNVDPRLSDLHSDPRFAAVLRSVGLAQ